MELQAAAYDEVGMRGSIRGCTASNTGDWVAPTAALYWPPKFDTSSSVFGDAALGGTDDMAATQAGRRPRPAGGRARRTHARNTAIQELLTLGEQWGGKLDAQDAGTRRRGRPLSDSGAKARFYHAVKDARLAHLIKVDLQAEAFSFSIDEDKQRYLELLDGKLLLVTNTDTPAAEVVQRYKSLADIERGFRVLKSDIEIGPVYHRLPQRIRPHALV